MASHLVEEEPGEDYEVLLVWLSVIGDDVLGVMLGNRMTKLSHHRGRDWDDLG